MKGNIPKNDDSTAEAVRTATLVVPLLSSLDGPPNAIIPAIKNTGH